MCAHNRRTATHNDPTHLASYSLAGASQQLSPTGASYSQISTASLPLFLVLVLASADRCHMAALEATQPQLH